MKDRWKLLSQSSIRRPLAGFTLIELVFVIIIIGLLASFAVQNVDAVIIWRQREDIRKFAHMWQYLHSEAHGHGEAYRLVIDLDSNSYRVPREVVTEDTNVREVDRIANMRLRSERARREQEQLDEVERVDRDQEFANEELRQSGALDRLFYETVFRDANGANIVLKPPLEESLAEPRELSSGLIIMDVLTAGGRIEEGLAHIRFTPQGTSDFAAVHFIVDQEYPFTVMVNPSSGSARIDEKYVEYKWKFDDKGISSQ